MPGMPVLTPPSILLGLLPPLWTHSTQVFSCGHTLPITPSKQSLPCKVDYVLTHPADGLTSDQSPTTAATDPPHPQSRYSQEPCSTKAAVVLPNPAGGQERCTTKVAPAWGKKSTIHQCNCKSNRWSSKPARLRPAPPQHTGSSHSSVHTGTPLESLVLVIRGIAF